jgi:hypothetical protein
MELATLQMIEAWAGTSLPCVTSSGWDPAAARIVLKELKRLRGELDAAVAVCVGALSASAGRDTKATVVRELGVSDAEANRIMRTAKVVSGLHGVAEAIAAGEYSADHVQRVAKLKPADAEELLAFASTQSPDDFEKRINKFLIDTAGGDRRARQRAERSVKFFTTEEGSIGMRAVLPETEGVALRANLKLLVDEQYLRDHPKRARVSSDHEVDRLDQRLADALIEAVNGDGDKNGVETKNGKRAKKQNSRGRTAFIVTLSLEELEAQILGHGAIDRDDALDLLHKIRTDIYFCVRDSTGAVMKFGRSRRFASFMQKLAMAVRQDGVCDVPGCDNPWEQSDAHHVPPFKRVRPGDRLGRTDIDAMRLPCRLHHQHEHDSGGTSPPHAA